MVGFLAMNRGAYKRPLIIAIGPCATNCGCDRPFTGGYCLMESIWARTVN